MKKLFLFIIVSVIADPVYAQRRQVHDAMEEKYGEPGKQQLNEWMQKMNARPEAEYAFPVSMVMKTTSYRKGDKKEETDLKYFFNTQKNTFAMHAGEQRKKEDMLMIYDYSSNTMVMLNRKDKTGMAISLNAFMSREMIENRGKGEGQKAGTGSDHGCKKTGKTKNIQGYPCEEYICTDKERNTRSEIWITDRVPVNIAQGNARGPYAHYFRSAGGLGGMIMEASFYEDDRLEATMLVTSVNEQENLVVSSSDYTFSAVPGMK